MSFRFKQFSISHNKSTLKVNTDAILLGSLTPIASKKQVLDIGTGCGIIALMIAQRTNSEAFITGIDIDSNSVEEAIENGNASPWKNRVKFLNISLQQFAEQFPKPKFDLIVSNPPFFVQSLKSPYPNLNLGKHNDFLSFNDLACNADKLLTKEGKFCVILPLNASENFENICHNYSLYCYFKHYIQAFPNKTPNRVILCFSREKIIQSSHYMALRDNQNNFSEEYLTATKDFHVFE